MQPHMGQKSLLTPQIVALPSYIWLRADAKHTICPQRGTRVNFPEPPAGHAQEGGAQTCDPLGTPLAWAVFFMRIA